MSTSGGEPPPPEQPGYWEQQAAQQPSPPPYQAPPPYQQPPYPGYPPYGQQGYVTPQYPYPAPPDHPSATTAMVLGILSVVCCSLTAPFAWVIGARAVREIDAMPGRYGGRGRAMAGKVLGIVGTVLLVLSIVYLVVVLLLALSNPTFFNDHGSSTRDALGVLRG